jgi:transglutaminase-like putative cysteine protease
MKYRIVHTTGYSYSEPASLSQNELFLHPRETGTSGSFKADLTIVPAPQYRRTAGPTTSATSPSVHGAAAPRQPHHHRHE